MKIRFATSWEEVEKALALAVILPIAIIMGYTLCVQGWDFSQTHAPRQLHIDWDWTTEEWYRAIVTTGLGLLTEL